MAAIADFIIVGGGTAGLLLANRLASRLSKPSVLVIEAGSDRSDTSYRNPSQRYMLPFTNPELDYGYSTLPQAGLADRVIPYPRGKGLGGSTLINFMLYLSGAKDDYDYWAELVGDDVWKWENSHRRLKELENFNLNVPAGYEHVAKPNKANHGQTGLLGIDLPHTWERGLKEIIEEAAKAGVPTNLDPNAGNPLGMGIVPTVSANGYRTTSASAHLLVKQDNLQVWTEGTVKRVILEGTRAVGVELVDGRKAFAKYETILTAGSFSSPKILMLSGIGPRDELEKHGIKVIKHLPGVGQTMKDHAAIFFTALMKPAFGQRIAFETNPELLAAATRHWTKDATGPLTTHMQSLAVMFNKIPSIYQSSEFLSLPAEQQEFMQRETIPTYECTFGGPKFPPTLEVPAGYEYLGITVFGMNPQSSGNITLASADVEDGPVIDARFLSHPFDKRVMIDGVIDALQMFKRTETYKNGFVKWLSGPEIDDDRDAVKRFVEEESIVVWHANGTAKMGKREDELKGICVDQNFKVLGIEGLRVADMSVSPVTINGHTQAAAYLIGATAAEKLIAEYNL